MKALILAVLLAASTFVATAQVPKAPSVTLYERIGTVSGPAHAPHPAQKRTRLFFCPPGKCLYYAGDFDFLGNNSNGLLDFNNPGVKAEGEVWMGVKPTKDAVITGVAGNYATSATAIGINPTPFAIRTGISAGQGGKLVCSTHGNAVIEAYGSCFGGINCYNYHIAKLRKGCPVKAGKTYYIDLTPQYNDGSTIGYLWDVEDKPPANHKGWPNGWDNSYFNSTSFGYSYWPTWGSSGVCLGVGCDLFSMALTGKESK